MKEITIKCKNEAEVQEGTRKLEAAGFKRTANCYWSEVWTGSTVEFTVIREF